MRVVFASSEPASTQETPVVVERGDAPSSGTQSMMPASVDYLQTSAGPDAGLKPVLFNSGADVLSADALAILDQLAEMMKSDEQLKLKLNGHTDHLGNDRTNLVLSIKRAYNVKYYLVYNHGIQQSRITSGGFGEGAPVASNHSHDGRELNRRVDFELSH